MLRSLHVPQLSALQRRSRKLRSVLLFACAFAAAHPAGPAMAGHVLAGIDVLEADGFKELQGKKIGLITNQTGKDRRGRADVDILAHAPGVELKALFAPEHGFVGIVENASVSSDTLKLADGREIPIYSLYGSTLAPTAEMLAGLDVLVFDIQDIGARFYTYATTMGMAMEAAAAHNVEFYVLDRPNPIRGDIVEGPLLDPDIRSFASYFPIPVRHGLTLGEIARLHNEKVKAKLRVVPLKGWRRGQWHDRTGLPWTKPSPNMPDLNSAMLYPGIGCLERTNVSVGRGTPHPFLWVGAPWLDAEAVVRRLRKAHLPGIQFKPQDLTPAKDIYAGRRCRGISLRLTDRDKIRPLRVFAHIVCALRDLHPEEFELRWDRRAERLVGSKRFLQLYESGAPPERIIEFFDADARAFERSRKPFLIY